MKPVIAFTMGDPAGVGPEVLIKAMSRPETWHLCHPVIFGSISRLQKVQSRFGKRPLKAPVIGIDDVSVGRLPFGKPSALGGKVSGRYIEQAVRFAQKGVVDALVTGPISKESFLMGGWGKKYPGHTEMLADLTGAKHSALLMVHGSLRAIHATSHVSLKKAMPLITSRRIQETIELGEMGLKQFGFRRPKIAVCGLNPHASDNGRFGREESKVIRPAIQLCRKKGIKVEGPFSSDTLWPRVLAKEFDLGVALYHDQGQIPIKLLAFQKDRQGRWQTGGVNMTVGLPIIRTSVAHGTGFEIAGKGVASDASFMDALKLAVQLTRGRHG